MKIIGVIPARYQSSRFPGKPLTMICGYPMVWWVYQQAKKVEAFYDVCVATDSEEIYNTCKTLEMNVVMTRSDHATGTDRLGEIAQHSDGDFFVNIQGDEPLIEPEVIQTIIDYKKQYPDIEVINTMTALEDAKEAERDSVVKVAAAENGDLLYLSRAAIPKSKKNQPVPYKKHLGLYGLSKDALLFFANSERGLIECIEDVEMLRFLENGYRIKIVEVQSSSIGVDLPEDVAKVEAVIKQRGESLDV